MAGGSRARGIGCVQRMRGQHRIIVGISGATGIALGARALELLREAGVETHLVVTRHGQQTRALETDLSAEDLRGLADVSYAPGDMGAAIASGSFRTLGMIVPPCSVRSLAEIAGGATSSLLTRAADVTLEGAPAARARGARDAAERGSSAEHAGRNRGGRRGRAARACVLPSPCVARGRDHARRGAGPRSVRSEIGDTAMG